MLVKELHHYSYNAILLSKTTDQANVCFGIKMVPVRVAL